MATPISPFLVSLYLGASLPSIVVIHTRVSHSFPSFYPKSDNNSLQTISQGLIYRIAWITLHLPGYFPEVLHSPRNLRTEWLFSISYSALGLCQRLRQQQLSKSAKLSTLSYK